MEALWLVGPLGLSGAQAAQALTMSPAAFRMRLMRARRLLRKALQRSSEHASQEFPGGGAAMNESDQRLSKVEQRLLDELLAYRAMLPADPPPAD